MKTQKIYYYSEFNSHVVEWVFRFFSSAIGCTFCAVKELSQAAVVYAKAPGQGKQLHIPFRDEYYDQRQRFCLYNGYWVPETMRVAALPIDYVGLVFRLLTLMDELNVPKAQRDPLGNLQLDLQIPRLEFCDRPMVDEVVQAFKQELIAHQLLREDGLLPRWPDGKRYAVVLTHDTDGPCLLEPRELAKAGAKGLLRRDGMEARAFLAGVYRLATGGNDPYFNFSQWAACEQSLGARSAFYVYMRSKRVPDHRHNPLYRVSRSRAKWRILHELVDRGWEIGLHASIHALERNEYVQDEKAELERFLGQAVRGNRSHYWSIDWSHPNDSLRRLAAMGMLYDCSIAWKGVPGFRSATVTPYHPYDAQNHQGLTLLEIPTNVMDGHLFEYQRQTDPSSWFVSITQHVRAFEGVLNLDWHTRTWVDKFSYRGWRTFLVRQLQKLVDTNEAWFTTPQALCEHWLAREQQIEGESSGNEYRLCSSL